MKWLLLLLLMPCSVAAEDSHSTNQHAIAWDSSFWQGFAGGMIAHELGHVAMAASFGQSSRLHAGSIIYPDSRFTVSEALRVSTAGFQTQWLLSEYAFNALDTSEDTLLDKQHYIGLITSHIAISLAYLAVLKDEPTSDIYNAAAVSGKSRNTLMWAALTPALLDAYRLWGDAPQWVDYLSIGIKAGEIGWIWTF
jgi:hypothetical protein